MKIYYKSFGFVAAFILAACGGGGGSSVSNGGHASAAIVGFSPSAGPPGTEVVITGSNFGTETSENTVKINGAIAEVTSASASAITVIVPDDASTGTISVVTTNGVADSDGNFIVSAGVPVIDAFDPLAATQGASVTIQGRNFAAGIAGNSVWFNGTKAEITAASKNSISVKVPPLASTGAIAVETEGGQSASTNIFSVMPKIESFSPQMGVTGTEVTINGSGFHDVQSVRISGMDATVVSRSDTVMTVKAPSDMRLGYSRLALMMGDGQYVTSVDLFESLPNITRLSTDTALANVRQTIKIFGTNFFTPMITGLKVAICSRLATVTYDGRSEGEIWVQTPLLESGMRCKVEVSIDNGGYGAAPTLISVYSTPPPPPNNTLSISPASLSFGSKEIGSYTFSEVTILNTGSVSLHIADASVSGGNFDYRGTNCFGYNYQLEYFDTLAPGASCTVDVGFNTTVVGPSTGSLQITSSAVGSPHIVALGGSGLEPAAPKVSLNSASLTFSARELGTASAPQVITITNTGTATLDGIDIGVSGEYTQENDCPTSLSAGAHCTIQVVFVPVRFTGTKHGSVSISSNEATAPHSVTLDGVGTLSKSGQLAIFTREVWDIDDVYVDGGWAGRDLPYDSQNSCGGSRAITLTLAPGPHSIEARDEILSISPATVTVVEGGCTVQEIKGTATCLPPSFVSAGHCYAYTPPFCISPEVLQNGVCVAPGTTSDPSDTSVGTNGGLAGRFVDTGGGTNAIGCLQFGYLNNYSSTGRDSQTIKNVCAFPVWVMWCHSESALSGTSSTMCNAAGSNRFYQQFRYFDPQEVVDNIFSLPPQTTIWYGACSGGHYPKGEEVSIDGSYICK